jgi:predicted enzyme related to lactoylglutathione lyase
LSFAYTFPIFQKIKRNMDKNVVGWFEIPTLDLDRAKKFYEKVLGLKLERRTMGPL